MEIAVDALTATYGTRFTFGNIADVICESRIGQLFLVV